MTLPAKRVLYALAFLAFAALSPLVVLYAWGYRYDFAKQQVEVTGILYLKSFPSRAAVTLNGQPVPDQTPAQLTGLQPGSYNVSVSRDGMQPWNKALVVRPQLATFAEDIVLFLSKPIHEVVQATTTASRISASPDGQLLATIARSESGPSLELQVRDADTNQVVATQTIAPTLAPYDIVWSQSSRRLAVVGSKQALAVVVGNSLNPILIATPLPGPWLSLQWDSANDNGLYAPSVHGLMRFDLATKRWSVVAREATLGLLQRGGSSMAVVATGSSAWLVPWPTSRASWKVALSSTTASSFTGTAGSDQYSSWQSGSSAWLIEATSSAPAVRATWSNVQQVTWSPHAGILAVLQPDSVQLFHQQDNATSSIPISGGLGRSTSMFWYPGGTHLYLARPGLLEVAEIDPRDLRNRYTLLDEPSFTGLAAASHASKYVYWVRSGAKLPAVDGLYRSAIQ
jgi:hypothetical protein